MAAAKACKAKMKDPRKWRISVNENLGWYWCLESKTATVTVWPSVIAGTYHCMIANPGSQRSGSFDWNDFNHVMHKDPNRAVAAEFKRMQAYVVSRARHVLNVHAEIYGI